MSAPARRASKVSPVEAMRESLTDGQASLKVRTIAGIVLAVIALALGYAALVATAGCAKKRPDVLPPAPGGTEQVDPNAGQTENLDAITAVVLGGTSLAGGKGRIVGTLIGALILGFLNNGLNLLGVSSYYQMTENGHNRDSPPFLILMPTKYL